jgi:hypothetical protein
VNHRGTVPRVSRKWVLLAGVALLAVVVGVDIGSRVLSAPWAIGYFGRDTLTGGWVGLLRAAGGGVWAVPRAGVSEP